METEYWWLENKPKIMREVRFVLRHFRFSRGEPVPVEPEFLHV